MTNREKIELLKTKPSQPCCMADYYQNLLEQIGGLKRQYYWTHYFYNKTTIDAEFPSIQKDMFDLGSNLEKDNYTSDFSGLDLFFKNMRIRIVVDGSKDYVRIKLRTLLKEYGYKRRSKMLVDYVNGCMEFFRLKAFLRGGVECEIENVDIDEMLTFRVV